MILWCGGETQNLLCISVGWVLKIYYLLNPIMIRFRVFFLEVKFPSEIVDEEILIERDFRLERHEGRALKQSAEVARNVVVKRAYNLSRCKNINMGEYLSRQEIA